MRLVLAAVGFTSTIAQVLLMREMVATFYGNELLFGLVLMAWLAWVAVGSWGLPRFVGPHRSGKAAIAWGLTLAAGLLPAQMALVRGTRPLLGVISGAFVPLGATAMAVVLTLAPLCLLVGLLFTLGVRMTVKQGRTAGQAYVWESVGALTGGALFSFVLIRWLNPFQVALLVASVNLVVALGMCRAAFEEPSLGLVALLLSLLVLLLVGSFPFGRYLHHATLRWPWRNSALGAGPVGGRSSGQTPSTGVRPGDSGYRLIFTAESPYGRLTVRARDGQRVFYTNGLLAFETQAASPEEVAHFPLLMDPSPQDVLLIGGGVAGDLREILKHPVDSVTYVELDPLLIEAAREHLPPEQAAVLDSPRVSVLLTDGRLFVRETSCSFDVIIVDLPAPSTGALNRFYTREFFAEVRAALKPDGVLSLGLPSAENYWSPELVRRNGSIYHTLLTVFSEVVALPGEHSFFLASNAPLTKDPTVLAERLSNRLAGASAEVQRVTPAYIDYVFGSGRFQEIQQQLGDAAGMRLNKDFVPICYYYTLILWLSRFCPAGALEAMATPSVWWAVVPLAALVLLVRWQRRWAVPFAIAGIGAAEMTLEVVILFAFQVLRGTLYAEVSVIVTAFMAGLALGGQGSNHMLARGPGRRETRPLQHAGVPRESSTPEHALSRRNWARRRLIAVEIAVGVYGSLFPLLLSLRIPAPRVTFPLLALVAGALTGMAFPLAVAVVRGRRDRVAGLLYGADLLGGCMGALLGSVLLVPVFGIPATCAVIGLVGLAGLLALV